MGFFFFFLSITILFIFDTSYISKSKNVLANVDSANHNNKKFIAIITDNDSLPGLINEITDDIP